MEYTIENAFLKVKTASLGAEVTSVIYKPDGVEHIWQADPRVWKYHSPILFPWCGSLKDDTFIAKGKRYSGAPHGFARELEHALVSKRGEHIIFELSSNEETLERWPYHFRLLSDISLHGDTLRHSLSVQNLDQETIRFGIGYHPGFALPFDSKHTYRDYELRFDQPERPQYPMQPNELADNAVFKSEIQSIPIEKGLFDHDTICMTGLKSKTLGLYEKDTGRGVVCKIQGFPYCLLWNAGLEPRFICIEPWHSLPPSKNGSVDWNTQPAAVVLNPGESWLTNLVTRIVRK